MSNSLVIEQLVLCEYATQDFQGKLVVAGISTGNIVFHGTKPNWTVYRIFSEIRPLEKNASAKISLYKKGGKVVFACRYKYTNDVLDIPDPVERNFLNIQIPPQAKFEGPGTYILEAKENDVVICQKELTVSVGDPDIVQVGEVSIDILEPHDGIFTKNTTVKT